MNKILLLDDNPHGLTRLEYQLSSITSDYRLVATMDPIEAVMQLRQGVFSMLFTNYRMAIMDGLSVTRIAHKVAPHTSVNIVTSRADAVYIKSQAAYAMCSHVIIKPCEISELRHIITQHQRYAELTQENTRLSARLQALEKYTSLNIGQANCS